jgi:hypothetical protein
MEDLSDVSFTPLAIAHSLVRKRDTKLVDGSLRVANYFGKSGSERLQKLVVVARAEDVSVPSPGNDLVVADGKGFEYLSESIRIFLKVGSVFFVADNAIVLHPVNAAISEFPFDHVLMSFENVDYITFSEEGIRAATVHVRFL